MRQPRTPSIRQLTLPLQCETTIRLGKEVREEAISLLADLLLEALGAVPVDPAEGGRALNESED